MSPQYLALVLFVVGVLLILSLLLTRGRYSSYDDYLRSRRWKKLRAEALHRDQWRCRLCNRGYGLQVHHRRYAKRWGKETVDDLTTVCDECHAMISYSGAQQRIYGR